MREILFRGKRVDNDKWVQGDFVSSGCGIAYTDYLNEHGDIGEVFCKVIPETVGQFTGLTDKNGKKIFEGDIFKPFDDEIICVSWIEHFSHLGLMVYSSYEEKKRGKVIKKDYSGWCMLMDYSLNELEIIGNIHDNPELLKGGDENA